MSGKRIAIDELPPRVRRLASGELSAVFGGCSGANGTCDQDSDCCDGYACSGVSGGAGVQEVWRYCQPK